MESISAAKQQVRHGLSLHGLLRTPCASFCVPEFHVHAALIEAEVMAYMHALIRWKTNSSSSTTCMEIRGSVVRLSSIFPHPLEGKNKKSVGVMRNAGKRRRSVAGSHE